MHNFRPIKALGLLSQTSNVSHATLESSKAHCREKTQTDGLGNFFRMT